ncbi:MAG TPA: TetR family transcriptional regulator [Blastocatellia bacterium]|nr:TetR family transcriptional regulator [Blastocatellia bacterium]
MVRKTKEEANLTRQQIIDAAREVFLTHGVSRTTLQDIAKQAGVTRGAVYWHFSNKHELFRAMRDQVFLPLIDRMDDALLVDDINDPLAAIEQFLCGTIQILEENKHIRDTYEIMMVKCEYVNEFADVLQQILSNCSDIVSKLQIAYQGAKDQGQLHPEYDPETIAMDTHLFFVGLLHLWVKDTQSSRYRQKAMDLIRSHMKLRRACNRG